MQKNETKIWHRLVAFFLSFVMVLGMLPANAVRAEETQDEIVEEIVVTEHDATESGEEPTTEPDGESGDEPTTEPDGESGEGPTTEPDGESGEEPTTAPEIVLRGVVTTITPNGNVDKDTVTFTNVTLQWVAADTSIGRDWSGWWVGIQVTAPDGAALETAAYKYGQNGEVKKFSEKKDGSDYITLWGMLNETYLRAALKKEGAKTLNYNWFFDWDADGEYEQNVKIIVDAESITLMNGDERVFPGCAVTIDHGYGQMVDDEGKKLESGDYPKGTVLTFTYQTTEGFELVSIMVMGNEVEADENGAYTVTINEDTAIVAETRDAEAPVFSNVTVTPESWAVFKTISAQVADNVGVAAVYISENSDYAAADDLLELTAEGGVYSCDVNRSATYYLHAVDAAGNVATHTQEVSGIDLDAPNIKYFIPGDENLNGELDDGSYELELTVSLEVTDEGSGVQSVYVSESVNFDDPKEELTFNAETQKYEFVARKRTTYYVHVVDNLGNSDTGSVYAGFIDASKPVVTLPEDICTNKKDISVEVKFEDPDGAVFENSGIQELTYYYITADGETSKTTTITDEKTLKSGVYTITVPRGEFDATYYVQVKDVSGKVSTEEQIHVVRDTVKPKVVSSRYPDRPSQINKSVLLYPDTVRIVVEATDNLSGVAKYEYQLCPSGGSDSDWMDAEEVFEVTKNGFAGRILVRVTDKAGNVSDAAFAHYENAKGKLFYYIELNSENAQIPVTEVTLQTREGSGNNYSYGEYVSGEWTNKDVVVQLNSTLKDGIAYYQYSTDGGANWTDVTIQSTSAETNGYTMPVIDADINAEYIFRAVSSKTDTDGSAIVGDEVKCTVKVCKTPPAEPQVTITGDHNGDNEWFCSEPAIQIRELASAYPGDLTIDTFFTIYKVVETEAGKELQIYQEGEVTDSISIPELPDGKYTVQVRTVDGADNEINTFFLVTGANAETGEATGESKSELDINVDTTAPSKLTIDRVYEQAVLVQQLDEEGNPVMVEKKDDSGNTVTELKTEDLINKNRWVEDGKEVEDFFFTNFYPYAIKIRLTANTDISGTAKLEYALVESVPATLDGVNWIEYTDEILVFPNQMFYLIFRATDNAGNETVIKSTGIVVDDRAPAGGYEGVPELKWEELDTPIRFGTEEFYADSFHVSVTVADPRFEDSVYDENGDFSGLKSVSYTVCTREKDGSTITSGSIPVDLTKNVVIGENGLISLVDFVIEVDKNTFNSNNIYIQVVAADNAGNKLTKEIGPFRIDTTRPKVNVTYQDTVAPENGVCYKAGRTMVIQVTERNFDPSLLQFVFARDNASVTIDTAIGKWIESEGTKNQDDKTWTLVIPCNDNGDYKLTVSELKDKAGWDVAAEDYWAEKDIFYDAFTVDTVAPVISVSYNNNTATNGKYFNAPRTVTVTVDEHNFDATRTSVTITASLEGKAVQVPAYNFVHLYGDIWAATIALDADGDYTFTAAATDLAGNSNAGINYGTSVAATEFTIDKSIANPSIGGVVDGGAYKDEVAPSVDIYDVNYDGYTLVLTRTNMQVKDEDVTEEFFELIEFVAPGGTLHTEDIPHLRENDGIYTLAVTIYDMAGNSSTTVTTFTVNRFGSVYVYDDYLMALISDGGAYVQSVTDDLIIVEYNADKLVSDSLIIEITCDGKPLENVIFEVTPEINDRVEVGESGWYQYKYTISKENFASDGVYKIYVSTKDATGNTSENTSYEDMGITFRVDSTLAEISSIVGLEEAIINATEQVVKYTVYDTMGIKSIKVYVDGELVDEITDFSTDLNNYSGSFTLGEQSSAQSVRIVVEDMSGNITDTDAETFSSAYEFNKSVTVSTNIFVRWYANKPLFWGSIGGVTVVAAALWFFLAAKRKKKEEVSTLT